jgi:NNP family nitrate/nitrite transporter-like MFS transporter
MRIKDFLRSGHLPTLFSAFLYFDISFMVWVMLGALGVSISEQFGLSATEKGMMVALPLLGGSLLRIPLGILTDRFGGKKTAIAGQLATMLTLVIGWRFANSMPQIYLTGLLLGVAGASFAVALPLASRWYPPRHQGLAMGIAGAGNSGTVLAAFFAPRLAKAFGWHAVFGLALIPMILMSLIFLILAKDSPNHPKPKQLSEYLKPMKTKDAWLFNFLYSVTFGGFVGLASFLPIFFHDQYGQEKVMAGNITALCVLAGSFVRPIGGYLADRFGGVRVLSCVYVLVGILAIAILTLPPLHIAVISFFLIMLALGSGNGSIFQLVPLRFKNEVGVVTGLVGAFGGLGGFFLPNILGSLKDITGTYSSGFMVFSLTALSAALVLLVANSMLWTRDGWKETIDIGSLKINRDVTN